MALETAKEVLCDAEILVAYVVRSGINFDRALIDQIIAAKAKITDGSLSAVEECAFYQAVNTLTAKLAPVSAQTLRACSEEFGVIRKPFWRREPVKYSYARLSVRRHRVWALVALALLLITQIYWLIGNNLVSGIPHLDENTATVGATPSAPVPSATPTSANAPTDASFAPSEAERAETAELTRMWLLTIWSTPWRWIPETLKKYTSEETRAQFAARSDFLEWGFSAKEVLPIFQIYVLPLLYGWVGAMAYVLRRMIRAVRELTYQRVYDIEFSLRVYLGVLAGVAIGWFFKPEAPTAGGGEVTFASVTPFALSFVAGYSVELLFTAMDRLVGAFTDRKSEKSPVPLIDKSAGEAGE